MQNHWIKSFQGLSLPSESIPLHCWLCGFFIKTIVAVYRWSIICHNNFNLPPSSTIVTWIELSPGPWRLFPSPTFQVPIHRRLLDWDTSLEHIMLHDCILSTIWGRTTFLSVTMATEKFWKSSLKVFPNINTQSPRQQRYLMLSRQDVTSGPWSRGQVPWPGQTSWWWRLDNVTYVMSKESAWLWLTLIGIGVTILECWAWSFMCPTQVSHFLLPAVP